MIRLTRAHTSGLTRTHLQVLPALRAYQEFQERLESLVCICAPLIQQSLWQLCQAVIDLCTFFMPLTWQTVQDRRPIWQ